MTTSCCSRRDDGGALVRLIAGDLDGHPGPGDTHTPITYAHATVSPGAELSVPWNPAFNALAYVLLGQGYAGAEGRPIKDHELVVFGPGDALTLRAADHQDGPSPRARGAAPRRASRSASPSCTTGRS